MFLLLVSVVVSAEESPWLLTPTLSSDPKLGTNVGAVAGYLFKLDPGSRQSVVGAAGSYSDTDFWIHPWNGSPARMEQERQ